MSITPILLKRERAKGKPTFKKQPDGEEIRQFASEEEFCVAEESFNYLKEKDGSWTIRQYTQDDDFFYRVGFKVDPIPTKVRVLLPGAEDEDRGSDLLPVNTQGNIYVEVGQIKKDIEKDPPPIVTSSGVYQVAAYDEENNELERSPIITILPNGIDKQSYQAMLSDLFNLYDGLVQKEESHVAVGESNAGVNGVNRTSVDLVKDFLDSVIRIRRNPRTLLKKTYKRTNAAKVRLFDARVAASYSATDGAGLVDSIAYVESPDIYENRVLKKELERLQGFCTRRAQSQGEFIKGAPKKLTKLDVCNNSITKEDSSDVSKREELLHYYNDVVASIEEELSHPWYEDIDAGEIIGEERQTKVFTDVVRYRESFELLDELHSKYTELGYDIHINAFGVRDTSQVYEYWVFFALLTHLTQNLGFTFSGGTFNTVKDQFGAWLKNRGKLEDNTVKLERKLGEEGTLIVELHFNCKREPESEDYSGTPRFTWRKHPLYPDYQLIFWLQDKKNEHLPLKFNVILDAKYNNFGTSSLKTMIKTVAVAKYFYHYNNHNPNEPVVGSFIIHPQEANDNSEQASSEEYEPKENTSDWLFGGKHHIGDEIKIAPDEWGSFKKAADEGSKMPDWANKDATTEANALPTAQLAGNKPYRYGAVHLSPANADEGLAFLFKLIFQYYLYESKLPDFSKNEKLSDSDEELSEPDKKKVKEARKSFLRSAKCWACGHKLKPSERFGTTVELKCPNPKCGEEFVSYTYCNSCGSPIVYNSTHDYNYRKDGKTSCPTCGNEHS